MTTPLGPEHEELERRTRVRRRRLVRLVGAGVVVALAVVFVVQNSAPVRLHVFVFSAHPRLIWVVLVSIVLGVVLGFLLGAPGRSSSRRRRREAKRAGRAGPEG